MNYPPAGTVHKKTFHQNDYLAPLAIPTGEMAQDVLGSVWRKNDIYIDVGVFAISNAVMVLWLNVLLCILISYLIDDWDVLLWVGVIFIYPVYLLINALRRPTPLPARFNRQRREVCVPVNEHDYWIVPWETVIAQATEHQSFSQAGKYSIGGGLVVGFKNPDPHAQDELKYCSFTFACGSVTASRRVWECMRSYMEIGPEAIEDFREKSHHPKGVLATYWDQLLESAQRKGWPMALLWEGFFGLFIFNILLIIALERWKLNPPPDLTYPDIIEWSKPLPPQQWAKRSPELEAAIAQREAELAAQKNL